MATEAELNLFNQLMATGDYAGAAQVAQQAGYNPRRCCGLHQPEPCWPKLAYRR
jgi:hypothetical protein